MRRGLPLTSLVLLLQLPSPTTSFLSNYDYGSSVRDALHFHCGTSSPSLVFPMTLSDDLLEGDSSNLDSTSNIKPPLDQENRAILQAKLAILEDIVIQLNATQCQDQEEILQLQCKVESLENSLTQEQQKYQTVLLAHRTELAAQEAQRKEQVATLQHTHQAELLSLRTQTQQEKDKLKQELLKETTNRKLEWKESMEIATAAVKAAEAREDALQEQLDELEARYHEEAAQYKTELGELQKEWKTANKRLEKEVTRLTTELTDSKRIRDKETTALLNTLSARNIQLEQDLKTAREQIQFQKLQFSTQQQVAREEWREQLEKERRFYTEAIRLLQRERAVKPSIWKRILRSVFGGRKGTSSSTSNGASSRLSP